MDFCVIQTITPMSIKQYLRQFAGLSLTTLRKIKHSGAMYINGHIAQNHDMVYPGDMISIHWDEQSSVQPSNMSLDIRYEDEYLLIINKPPGLLVHPTVRNEQNTLANGVMFYYEKQQQLHGFHPVNRIDRNTSGLIVIAKNSHIQHALSQNHVKSMKRRYIGIATGRLQPQQGVIDAPIGRTPTSIIERMVRPDGQSAITRYHVVEYLSNEACLLQLELQTGRTHQIRVHLAHIGHPLLGDDLYGGSTELINRQALHAAEISFIHPITHEALTIHCPLPKDMLSLADYFYNTSAKSNE